MVQLDHIVIRVDNLEQAVNDYREMGFNVAHESVQIAGTRFALIYFSNGVYFMLMERVVDPVQNGFAAIASGNEGLAGFAIRTDGINAEATRLRSEGFAVGEIVEITQTLNQREIRWKMATIDGGFKPYLVQDVTPTEWRVLTDQATVTHPNHAVRVPAVIYAVPYKKEPTAKDYVDRLTGQPLPEYLAGRRDFSFIVLDQYNGYYSNYTLEEYVNQMKPIGGGVSQEQIEKADPAQEPEMFSWHKQSEQRYQSQHSKGIAREIAMISALGDRDFALFGVDLVREEANTEKFTPERRHGVWFQHLTGAPKERGAFALADIDDIDWSGVHHAYGPASDVPDLLRALASDNFTVRDHAHYTLIGNIVHQGSIYPASIEAIPFLMRLIDDPEIDNRFPVDLLGYITGDGLAIPELKDATQQHLDQILPLVIKNLSNNDPIVRIEMAEELGLYSWERDRLEPLLKDRIVSDPSPHVRATSLSSLLELWLSGDDVANESELTPVQREYIGNLLRNTSVSPSVRFGAARFLVRKYPDEWLNEGVNYFYKMMTYDERELASLSSVDWTMIIWYDVPNALKAYPVIVLDWLIAHADHKNPKVRKNVANALSRLVEYQGIPFEQVLPTVRKLIKDPSPDVRQSILTITKEKEHLREITTDLVDLAENDPSIMIRRQAKRMVDYLQAS